MRLSAVVAHGLLALDLAGVQKILQVAPDFVPAHVADHGEVAGALRLFLQGGQDLSLISLLVRNLALPNCASLSVAVHGSTSASLQFRIRTLSLPSRFR